MDDLPPPVAASRPRSIGLPELPQQTPTAPRAQEPDPRREQSDQHYQAIAEFGKSLPREAKSPRVQVYELNERGQKTSTRPVGHILSEDIKDLGLSDVNTMRAHLLEEFGPGHYQLEPTDAHGNRLQKLATWTVDAGDPEDMDDNDDDPQPARRFRRSRRPSQENLDDEDDVDDPNNGRGIIDYVEAAQEREKSEAQRQKESESTMMQTLMMMQQQQAAQAREAREEERRREERREEAAKRDEERRREERKIEEERRREERKMEEDRRREERREDEERRRADRADKATLFTALTTAVAPILAKIVDRPKDDTLPVLLAKLIEPKPQDPLMVTVLNKVLEGSNDKNSIQGMLSGMAEINKMSTQLQGEAMRNMMTTSSEMNQQLVKKAIEMATNLAKQTPGGEQNAGTLDKLLGILGQASAIVGNLAPTAPAQALPQPAQAAPAAQPPAQPAQPAPPVGYDAVAECLYRLQTKQLGPNSEQVVMDYLLQQMPVELKEAVVNDQGEKVTELCTPAFTKSATYLGWIAKPESQVWVQDFLEKIKPTLRAQLQPAQPPASEVREVEVQVPGSPEPAAKIVDPDDPPAQA